MIDWNLVAVWAQSISSTIVLFMIFFQIKQVNTQIIQNDSQERFRRSWEFIKTYLDEVRQDSASLEEYRQDFEPCNTCTDSKQFQAWVKHFYRPRVHLFYLLNKLIEHQEADERLLFGYLEEDFNTFVLLGINLYGLDEFKKNVGSRIRILLSLWGSQIPAAKLLYSATGTSVSPQTRAPEAQTTAGTPSSSLEVSDARTASP